MIQFTQGVLGISEQSSKTFTTLTRKFFYLSKVLKPFSPSKPQKIIFTNNKWKASQKLPKNNVTKHDTIKRVDPPRKRGRVSHFDSSNNSPFIFVGIVKISVKPAKIKIDNRKNNTRVISYRPFKKHSLRDLMKPIYSVKTDCSVFTLNKNPRKGLLKSNNSI